MRLSLTSFVILMIAVSAATGCGKKADAHKPVQQVRAEAEKMSVSDLQKTARAYAEAVRAKKSELAKVTEDLKKLSPKDLLSEKSKTIKDKASALGDEIGELTGRYEIYARKFTEKGGDVTKIKIAE